MRRVWLAAIGCLLGLAGCPDADPDPTDPGGDPSTNPPTNTPTETRRALIPDDRMVLYHSHAMNSDPLHPNTDQMRLVVDLDGNTHILEEGLLRTNGHPWYVQALGWNEPGPQDAALTPVAVVGFDLVPDNTLAIGITPLTVNAFNGPSGGIVRLDGTTQTYLDFVETGELIHDSGLDRIYMPLAGSHVTSKGALRVDLVGGPFPWADNDNYGVPFAMNEVPVRAGGMYSPFTQDKFYQRFLKHVFTDEGSKLYQGTIIVRVAMADAPEVIHCDCVDVDQENGDRCILNAPSSRCFSFRGVPTAAAVGDDDVFYFAEAGTGDIWGHHLEDTTNSWHKVATGFEPVTAGPRIQDLFFAQDGSGVLFVLAQDGVYALKPDLTQTFERSTEPVEWETVPGAVNVHVTPCVPGQPCIEGEAVLAGTGGTCFIGTDYGFQPGVVHVDDEVFENSGWSDTNVCVQLPDVRRPNATLWVELPDGTQSNRVELVMPPWLDSVEPTVLKAGETFTIKGGNFGERWPAGFTWVDGAFDVESWSDTEITGRVMASVKHFFNPVIAKVVMDPAIGGLGPGLGEIGIPVQPTLFGGCTGAPGTVCRVQAAGGLSAVRVNGEEVEFIPSSEGWFYLTVPELPPGEHTIEVENGAGMTDSAPLSVLGWMRHVSSDLSSTEEFGLLEYEGVMHGVPGGGQWVMAMGQSFALADDGDWYVNGVSIGFRGFGGLGEHAHNDRPFVGLSASFGGSGRVWDLSCGTPRVATDGMRLYGAGRVSAIPNQQPVEIQIPDCQGIFPYLVEAGSGDAPGDEFTIEDTQLEISPMHGGELGKVAGMVSTNTDTFLAIRNETDAQTELYRHANPYFVREAVLPAHGALLRAGDYAYLAGGEKAFDGLLYEFYMWEEQLGEPLIFQQREIPPVQEGLAVERQPLWSGADDGALYAAWIDDGGVLRISRFAGGGEDWQEVATVPSSVPGVPEPEVLAVDPASLEVVDFGVLNGRIYLLSQFHDGQGVRLEVHHQTDPAVADSWTRTHEELASWWPFSQPCVGPWEDPNVYCGSASGTFGCALDECSEQSPSWTPRVGSANRARLNASHGELWVVYEVRYDDAQYQGFLGEDRIIVAKLAVEPADSD